MKIPDRLLPLLEQGLIHEVIRPLMSGKEAAVYVVAAQDGICVAKVYKDAEHRSFRQRSAYIEGRQVRNSRQRRAMEKGSKYGKEQTEAAWQNAEVDALYKLHAAGLRVPRPIMFSDGVLLMDMVMNSDGEPAPRLCDCNFTPEQAWRVLEFVVYQVAGMLCNGLIHGDLSEYNVLLAWDGPMIIDLPKRSTRRTTRAHGLCWCATSRTSPTSLRDPTPGWPKPASVKRCGACTSARSCSPTRRSPGAGADLPAGSTPAASCARSKTLPAKPGRGGADPARAQ
jgi:serine/threonine-protein kinase RIO1